MADPGIGLLILDELNIALRYDYLPLADVVEALKARRPELTRVVTGRNAKPELIAAADCVTEWGGEAPFRGGLQGAGRHRVLNGRNASPGAPLLPPGEGGRRSRPDEGGTYELILGPDDPSHINWIDTGGLSQGIFAIRCLLPERRFLPGAEIVRI